MANRHDREREFGVGRRASPRGEEGYRYERAAQGRYEGRGRHAQEGPPYERPSPWRDARGEAWQDDAREYGHRSERYYPAEGQRWNRDERADDWGRDRAERGPYRGWHREEPTARSAPRPGYPAGGRGGRYERYDADRGDPYWREERQGGRGAYPEPAWAREPRAGHPHADEFRTRGGPGSFNAGDESHDRWQVDVREPSPRFDTGRRWDAPGTSGYGNTTRGQTHYGKGPKGYTRSDERIREDVCDRLSDDDEVDASDISVTVTRGEVILEGTVTDRRTKHRAEDIADSVSGVRDVTNRLRARKTFFQELGDKLTGDGEVEHHGHRGSGTRSAGTAPPGTAH